ncbi:MAG: HMA2 domain-containing protein [Deltaproteobacteria bacterium]
MLPDAYLSHQTSGRIRVKIPSKKGDDSYFKNANALLQQHKGIDRTEVNPLTGSILIIHSGNSTSVMKIAETNKLFRLNGANQTPTVAAGIKTTFNDFNTQVKRLTGHELDISTLAFLILLAAGLYQISIGNAASIPWYTAIWYGMNIFLKGA